jgi:caffeoyl-CoA O-methyltransferase
MITMNNNTFEAVDYYIADLLTHEDKVLKETEQSITQSGMPKISVSPNQGKLLNMLALLCKAERILEIGALGGYSTIWLARALPPKGKLISLEMEPKHAQVARENIAKAQLESKVEFRIGMALDILPHLQAEQAGPFDMIFIDADKSSYPEYFQWALQLSHPGTLIVADNVVRAGEVLNNSSTDADVKGTQRFNKMVSECPDVTATILQTVGVKGHDGMALVIVNG